MVSSLTTVLDMGRSAVSLGHRPGPGTLYGLLSIPPRPSLFAVPTRSFSRRSQFVAFLPGLGATNGDGATAPTPPAV